MKIFGYLLPAACVCCLLLSGCGSSKKSVASRDVSYQRRTAATAHSGKKQPLHIAIDNRQLPEPTVRLLAEADTWLGVPYRYGGNDRDGVDCSALVLQVFDRSLKLKVPRNSRKQYDFCAPVDRTLIVPGDLVFFSTPSSGDVGHVGIYVGNGNMVHASSSRGVVLSNIDEPYFVKHFRGAGRVEQYFAMLGEPTPAPQEPAVAIPAVTLAELPAVLAASKPAEAADKEAAAPLVIPKETAASQRQIEPAAAVTPVIASAATSSSAMSAEDARRKVLNAFREVPADSVLTVFFD